VLPLAAGSASPRPTAPRHCAPVDAGSPDLSPTGCAWNPLADGHSFQKVQAALPPTGGRNTAPISPSTESPPWPDLKQSLVSEQEPTCPDAKANLHVHARRLDSQGTSMDSQLPTGLRKASAVRSCLRFVNDYRGWCARRGIPPSWRLAKIWRLVVSELWVLRRLHCGDESRTGRRVRRLVPITARHATALLLRRDELRKLQSSGLRLLVTRRDDGPLQPLGAQQFVGWVEVLPLPDGAPFDTDGLVWLQRVRAAAPLTEDALRARLRMVAFTAPERKALAPVITGLKALEDASVDVCRTCGKRWLIRRGRTLDCAECRRRVSPWTRTRRSASRRRWVRTRGNPRVEDLIKESPLLSKRDWSELVKREAQMAELARRDAPRAQRIQERARRRRDRKARARYRSVTERVLTRRAGAVGSTRKSQRIIPKSKIEGSEKRSRR
jgi:hypothetical protein